jgi:hypothetical protein
MIQMIPIESFEAMSMSGVFVPIVSGGTNMKLTFQNRRDYVEKALQFRLHELDQQVSSKCDLVKKNEGVVLQLAGYLTNQL